MLKVDLLTSDEALGPFLNEVWESEKIPEDLRKGVIVKITNKGDIFVCANWTIITLLSMASKMFWRISFNRITTGLLWTRNCVRNKQNPEQEEDAQINFCSEKYW